MRQVIDDPSTGNDPEVALGAHRDYLARHAWGQAGAVRNPVSPSPLVISLDEIFPAESYLRRATQFVTGWLRERGVDLVAVCGEPRIAENGDWFVMVTAEIKGMSIDALLDLEDEVEEQEEISAGPHDIVVRLAVCE